MKRSMIGCGVMVLMLMAGQALAQNEKPKGPAPAGTPKQVQPSEHKPVTGKPGNAQPGGPDAMMQEMIKAAAPGPEHEAFKKFAGTWDASVKMFEPGSDAGMESKGVMTNTLVMGGRFVRMEYKGEFMGGPFEGSGLWGYDKASKKYQSTWTDTLGTGIEYATGTFDAASKSYTSMSEFDMFGEGGKVEHIKQREVVKVIDDNKHTMEMFHTGADGKEMKVMEITYTRAGSKTTPAKPAEDKPKTNK